MSPYSTSHPTFASQPASVPHTSFNHARQPLAQTGGEARRFGGTSLAGGIVVREGARLSDEEVEKEKKAVRKIDRMLVPILTSLYLLSFLDRSNIGNAKLDGLIQDLKITDYSTVSAIFFVGYVVFELPANWALKRLSPPIWLPTLTLVWGIIAVVMGLVPNQPAMYAVRFFLGATEAGLFPGVIYTFSQFYVRKERHYRTSMFFSAAALAGAFGGVLAYGLSKMDGIGGKLGWSWIFIIEGLLTVVVSTAAYFLIPTYPAESSKFTEEEKKIISRRLADDSDALDLEPFNWVGVRQAFSDVYVWLYAGMFHGFAFGLYTLSLFLPSIIAGLGYASWKAQLLTVPPYAFAFLCTMATAHASFLVDRRAPFIMGGGGVAIVGYIGLVAAKSPGAKYFFIFLCTAGIYSANALLLSWPAENVSGQTKRATALALQISIGDVGAIVGTELYRMPLGDLTNENYRVSTGLTILWTAFGVIFTAALWVLMGRENARRERLAPRSCVGGGDGDEGGVETADEKECGTSGTGGSAEAEEERRLFGDRWVGWRYQL